MHDIYHLSPILEVKCQMAWKGKEITNQCSNIIHFLKLSTILVLCFILPLLAYLPNPLTSPHNIHTFENTQTYWVEFVILI